MITGLRYELISMKNKLWYACARAEDECRYRWNLARVTLLEKSKGTTDVKQAAAEEKKAQGDADKQDKKPEQQDCKEVDLEYIASKDVRAYLRLIGKNFTEEEKEALIHNAKYVFIPHPFRRGDICKRVNSDVLGVVFSPTSEIEMYEQEQRSQKGKYKNSRMCIEILELSERGEFEHETVPVDEIEYAQLEKEHPAQLLLEEARELMLGRGSIPCVQELQREYQVWLATDGHFEKRNEG